MSFSVLPLSYCANVHPGRTVDEILASLERFAAPLRQRIDRPIAVGLWFPRSAVDEAIAHPHRIEKLGQWLHDHDLVCYTMNAFPFGDFHATRVKENVYLPDWASRERRDYTCNTADLLARLLPPGAEGSISTSPCAFKALHPAGEDISRYFPLLVETATHLAAIKQQTDRTIRLAIEPEPCCVLETTEEAIAFFQVLWRFVAGRPEEAAVREHLGVCFDVCHQAVEFEDVRESIDRLDEASIRINKLHITSALELADPKDDAARQQLARFVEERYLHQTFGLHPDGRRLFIPDLTVEHSLDASADWLECSKWRIHFHVPVNESELGLLRTTRPQAEAALERIGQLPYAPHLEVETYTWNVLAATGSTTAAGEQFDLVAGLEAELSTTLKLLPQNAPSRGWGRLLTLFTFLILLNVGAVLLLGRTSPLNRLGVQVFESWEIGIPDEARYGVSFSNAEISDDDLDEVIPLLEQMESNARGRLFIPETRMTDEGLARLLRLPGIHTVSLSGERITDNTVQVMTKSPSLKYVLLLDTSVTSKGEAMLLDHNIRVEMSPR